MRWLTTHATAPEIPTKASSSASPANSASNNALKRGLAPLSGELGIHVCGGRGKHSRATPQELVPVDRGRMRTVAPTVLEGEGVADYEISLAFVDNATIHVLNKRYLNHDEPTDVLSFPLSDVKAKKLTGELVLGVEVAKERAEEMEHAVDVELALYVIHGLLHLCGYDDKSDSAERDMRDRERHFLQVLGLPDIAEKGSAG